jgi:hypothetical protein
MKLVNREEEKALMVTLLTVRDAEMIFRTVDELVREDAEIAAFEMLADWDSIDCEGVN